MSDHFQVIMPVEAAEPLLRNAEQNRLHSPILPPLVADVLSIAVPSQAKSLPALLKQPPLFSA